MESEEWGAGRWIGLGLIVGLRNPCICFTLQTRFLRVGGSAGRQAGWRTEGGVVCLLFVVVWCCISHVCSLNSPRRPWGPVVTKQGILDAAEGRRKQKSKVHTFAQWCLEGVPPRLSFGWCVFHRCFFCVGRQASRRPAGLGLGFSDGQLGVRPRSIHVVSSPSFVGRTACTYGWTLLGCCCTFWWS